MKKLIFILLTVLSFGTYAQTQVQVLQRVAFRKDTIKCMIQYSDTSKNFNTFFYERGDTLYTDTIWYCNETNVLWMHGYIVFVINGYGDRSFVCFLDNKKKPLSENIIVWQFKEL